MKIKFLPLLFLVLFCACWYSFTLRPYPDIETVFVEPFTNQSDRYELSTDITEGLISELNSNSLLKLSNRESTHSILSGEVNYFNIEAYTYTSGEEPVDYRVTIRAKVRFAKAGSEQAFWDSTLEGFATYPLDESTKSESQAINEAVFMLIGRIVDRLRTG
ncbi:LptE family protein [bacterium]|nr:LptE family protein [bacterium]